MKKSIIGMLCALGCMVFNLGFAQSSQKNVKPQVKNLQMKFLGKFNAGVPNAGIYKMYDASDDIVCYILMPDIPETKRIAQGIMYEGNSIGSISCVKVKLHVVPIQERPIFSGKK